MRVAKTVVVAQPWDTILTARPVRCMPTVLTQTRHPTATLRGVTANTTSPFISILPPPPTATGSPVTTTPRIHVTTPMVHSTVHVHTQVQVLREFLSEYEHEASGGGCAASSGSGGGGGRTGSSGSHNGGGLSESPGGDVDDGGMTADDGVGGGVAVGGGSGVGMGGGGGDNPSRGRDWVRHELCGKLVSNLFSSKSLRERLSKKPVAGILVGLLCGPPPRISRPPQSAQSVRASKKRLGTLSVRRWLEQ